MEKEKEKPEILHEKDFNFHADFSHVSQIQCGICGGNGMIGRETNFVTVKNYLEYSECPACKGSGLKPFSRFVVSAESK